MSFGYVDSSCLAAVSLGEAGHEELATTLDEFEVLLSNGLLEAEVRSAVQREGLHPSVADDYIGEVEWVIPGRHLAGELGRVLSVARLKGADLWHVANALFARDSMQIELSFLTLDAGQREVAAALGFDTSAIP